MIPDYVFLTDSIAGSIKKVISSHGYSQIDILVDENTLAHCYPLIKKDLPDHNLIETKSGEEHKNLKTCEKIWSELTAHRFDRNSLLINLGGGVIGDMGGFCAATYKRGIDFIQVPTTLLSQVDASVGGKLGIDFQGFKNHLGVFKIPVMVLIDPIFLNTLSERQIKSGFAEVIKHGLINDRSVFEDLIKINVGKVENWRDIIKRSIEIKGEIVNSDPYEKGPRKLLNFGHTIGHAIESYFMEAQQHNLLHGEAIAIGMVCESWLSNKKLRLPQNELDQISSLLIKTYGKVDLSVMDIDKFQENLFQDKKNKGNNLLFTLLHDLGYGKFDIPVSSEESLESLEYYKGL